MTIRLQKPELLSPTAKRRSHTTRKCSSSLVEVVVTVRDRRGTVRDRAVLCCAFTSAGSVGPCVRKPSAVEMPCAGAEGDRFS